MCRLGAIHRMWMTRTSASSFGTPGLLSLPPAQTAKTSRTEQSLTKCPRGLGIAILSSALLSIRAKEAALRERLWSPRSTGLCASSENTVETARCASAHFRMWRTMCWGRLEKIARKAFELGALICLSRSRLRRDAASRFLDATSRFLMHVYSAGSAGSVRIRALRGQSL